jgi:adenylate cyclase
VLLAAAAIVAITATLAFAGYFVAAPDAPGAAQRSVAVLPFRNSSPDQNDAYFAAGLHEEVLDRLAVVGGLTVIGRTSVMGYADTTRAISEIADELHVGAVLEGSASRVGDRVRVSVRLVAAATNEVLWAELYEGDLGDVFTIQSDIAVRIAAALQSQLSPDELTTIARRPTQSLEAYALFLRALALYRDAGGIGPAMPDTARAEMQSYFDRAIALDPSFAAAYAWKAYIYVDSLFFDPVPEGDWTSRSRGWAESVQTNAEQALSIDSGSSVAHVASARLSLFRWRLADSRAALERALSSNPNDSQALQQMALLYAVLGEFPQAIATARRALDLDPKNPGNYGPLAVALQLTGQHAAAAAAAEAMMEAAPRAAIAYVLLARAAIAGGDVGKALEALKLAERLGQQSPNQAVDLAVTYRGLGQIADAERLINSFPERTEGLHVSPAMQAQVRLARGDHDGALRQATLAFESRELGADPLALAAIQWNVWSLAALEEQPWRELRSAMAHRD